MILNEKLEEYLATPMKQRTKLQRSIAYIDSYDQLIDWWQAFQTRNHETPIMRGERIVINIPEYIQSLIEKRNNLLLTSEEYELEM